MGSDSNDSEMEGVDPSAPGKPSLEQLKALDSLPNLQAQLKTAGDLCNHAHRAEMILRWLAGKLQKDGAAGLESGSWTVFTKCLRLIAPSKIGALLSRFDLPAVVKGAVTAVKADNLLSVLEATAQLFQTIIEISEGPQGASVLRLVCAESAHAAAFSGAWFDRSLELWRLHGSEIDPGRVASPYTHLLETPIDIWKLRKPGAFDNASFGEHCLVPCSLLLSRVHALQLGTGPSKRKRTSTGSVNLDELQHKLELLLAKHVLLPTRSIFFQIEGSAGYEKAATKVREAFAPLSSSQTCNSQANEILETIPLLLDIALRSVSVPTSRQRIKERPWVEAVFAALLRYLDGQSSACKTLAEMLSVIGRRSSMKLETLASITNKYAGLQGDAAGEKNNTVSEKIDFHLIANVVELDSSVFIDDTMADNLFRAITAEAKADPPKPHGSHDARHFPLEEIVLKPVMKAFANARRLDAFIQLWHRQIQDLHIEGPWTQLEEHFADLLEHHYNAEQIESLLEQYSGQIRAAKDVEASKMGSLEGPVCADFVVLSAIARGIRSEAVRDHVQRPLQDLFALVSDMGMVQAFGDKKKVGGSLASSLGKHVWRFLSQALRLWFPAWAAQQSSKAVIEVEARRLLSGPILECARSHSTSANDDGAAPSEQFIGLLCHLVDGYEGCRDLATGNVRRLSFESPDVISSAFAMFPDLLNLLEEDDCRKLVHEAVTHLASAEPNKFDVSSLRSSLAVVAHSTTSNVRCLLLDDLINELLQPLRAKKTVEIASAYEMIALDILSHIPASTLSGEQRATIINGLMDLTYGQSVNASQLNARLALIVKMLEGRGLTTKLTTDAETLWRLCPRTNFQSSNDNDGTSTSNSRVVETLGLLAQIVRHVITHIIRLPISDDVHGHIEGLWDLAIVELSSPKSKKGKPLRLDRMVVATVTMQELARIPRVDDYLLLGDSKGDNLTSAAKAILKDIKQRLEDAETGKSSAEDHLKLRVELDAMRLFVISPFFRESSHFRLDQLGTVKIAEVARKVINSALVQHSGSNEHALSRSTYYHAAVSAYNLLRATAREADVLGKKLFQVALSPEDRRTMLDLMRQEDEEEEDGNYEPTIRALVQINDNMDASTMEMVQSTIPRFRKDMLTSCDGAHAAESLLPRLLEILLSPDFAAHRAASSCIITILRDKPFLVNQYLAELTLKTIKSMARTSPAESLIYIDLCAILTTIFTHHRAKLQGRYHLVIAVLQALQSRLFKFNKPSSTAERTRKPLTTRHARTYTRLLTLFCNPPVHKRQPASELVDESRRARAHVGEYVQYLLHYFCTNVLSGTLGEGVREALTPGLWAIIEAMTVHSPESVKVLSASMNNSERAVLRGVYDDWKRFGKWEGT